MISRRESVFALFVVSVGFVMAYHATEPSRRLQRRNTCYSNLKQIGLAMQLYAQDYDEIYPRAWYGRDAGSSDAKHNYKWMDAIFPYIKETKNFTCPIDTVNKPYIFRSGQNYGSYVINNAYFAPGDAQTPPAGSSWGRMDFPAGMVLVTEGEGDFQFAWPTAWQTPALESGNPFHFGSIRGRHSAGIHESALTLGCDASTSTASLGFIYRTNVIRGQKIYSAFTIEADESSKP